MAVIKGGEGGVQKSAKLPLSPKVGKITSRQYLAFAIFVIFIQISNYNTSIIWGLSSNSTAVLNAKCLNSV